MFARSALVFSCVALVASMAALSVVLHLVTTPAERCTHAAHPPPSNDPLAAASDTATSETTSIVRLRADELSRLYHDLFASCDRQLLGLNIGSKDSSAGMETTVRRFPPIGPTEVVEIVQSAPGLEKRSIVILEY